PIPAPVPGLPAIAGLDNARVGVLNDNAEQLNKDLELLKKSGQADKNLEKLDQWWQEQGKEHASTDKPVVRAATLHGDRMALTWRAAVPAMMAVGYLLLLLYFMARGGYKQVHISAGGEEVEDAAAVAARAGDKEYGIQRPSGVKRYPE